ncbi:chaperonin-like RbcX protein 2, chloroplastic [Ipomoea triloba]|uniref:chaperonin-like RbcX protein 2, chloroplastic n=1 Tax=Ipomoea triloba TaxID=35885 RepID=UPI00125E0440|nr:chaperonin-like RbcX protein 2, chloroplastic [Ipomoea triloba]
MGTLGVVVSSMVMDSHSSQCLCLNALPSCNLSGGDLALHRNSSSTSLCRRQIKTPCSLELSTSFLDRRGLGKGQRGNFSSLKKQKQPKKRGFTVVNELGGQYEETFEDVKSQILNYFTYKAVMTVLDQLQEMNPPQYQWLNGFIETNKPRDGKHFIRNLVKEKQDLAERVMITRLHLYGKWIKKCDHDELYNQISDQNLEVMRERLVEIVIWPSDDTNTEVVG